MKDTEQGAVVYVRVSTAEQARDPLNLKNQEQRCRDYCSSRKLEILQTFIDPGESARSADRPEFKQLVQFCKHRRNGVGFVVIYDLSRFARNIGDQAEAITELAKCGVRVRSTLEPNVDETAAGKLAANIHGAFNQYFSDALSEKMKERSRAAVLAGRWPWSAPLGYKNVDSRDGANIVPDLKIAPHISTAFELMATGLYTRAAVLRKITDAGLRTREGNTLTPQTFYQMLRKKVYMGLIECRSVGEAVKGLHAPLVSMATFECVQDILDGKKAKAAPKHKFNVEFPLKPFIRCSDCDRPLTGGFARSHTGKHYPRYWCRTAGCRAVGISREQLESQFINLLERLSPTAETMGEFPVIAAKVWQASQAESELLMRKTSEQLETIRALKRKLLEGYLQERIAEEDYQLAVTDYTAQISDLERQLSQLSSDFNQEEEFVQFAELHLSDLAHLWRLADDEQRRRVQTILFRDGLSYSQETKSLNPKNSTFFKVLEEMNPENLRLASPTGFEPVLPP